MCAQNSRLIAQLAKMTAIRITETFAWWPVTDLRIGQIGHGLAPAILKSQGVEMWKCKCLLDPYQYNNNTKILRIWAWERCRPSVCKRLQKENKIEKNGIGIQFSIDKKLATSQDRKTLQNSNGKQYCQQGRI